MVAFARRLTTQLPSISRPELYTFPHGPQAAFRVIGIALATVAGGTFGMYEDARFRRTHLIDGTGKLLKETFRWRQMAASLASGALVTVEAIIKNQSSLSVQLDTIVPVDSQGWPLPAEISYPFDPPAYLGPGQEQTLIAHMKMQREVATTIRNFTVQTK